MKVKHPMPKGFTLIELLVVMTIIAVLAAVGFSAFTKARETANKTNAIQNVAGNLKTALMTYAGDNQDSFPDAKSGSDQTEPSDSNTAFRKLIASGYVNDEAPFVIRGGAAKVDGDVGDPPGGTEALKNGECHYALAKGLTVTSNASYPLLWEAPESGKWNPEWNAGADRNEWGSAWSDDSVLVMTVGGSVATIKLAIEAGGKGKAKLKSISDKSTKNIFDLKTTNGDALNPLK